MKTEPSLLTGVEAAIDRHQLFRPGQSILVAVSGGVDSVVLLHLLASMARQRGWGLRAAHFNHQMRGRSSDADETFVRHLAKKLKLPFTALRQNVRRYAAAHKLSPEMAGRKLRHAFFAETALKQKIPVIALAHHADDQVELFFLRLLRGTGSPGLAGMAWKNPSPANPRITLVRPLLDQFKCGLQAYAKQESLGFREDATNTSLDIRRNRIRHELIPLLTKKYQPALGRVVLRLMEILRAEFALGEELLDRGQNLLEQIAFADLPIALQRRHICQQLKFHGMTSDFNLVEKLREYPNHAPRSGKMIQRDASGALIVQKAGKTGFTGSSKPVRLRGRQGKIHFETTIIHWERLRQPNGTFSAPKAQAGLESFDAEKLGLEMVLRHWQPGDRFQPIGLLKPVKLQNLFTNHKIARDQRHKLLVATTKDGEIFWVEGVRMGERFKLDSSSRYRLKWAWKRLC